MKPKHILVPVDLTETSRAGLRMASDLARQFGAALTVVHVEMASTVLSEAMAGHLEGRLGIDADHAPRVQRRVREFVAQTLSGAEPAVVVIEDIFVAEAIVPYGCCEDWNCEYFRGANQVGGENGWTWGQFRTNVRSARQLGITDAQMSSLTRHSLGNYVVFCDGHVKWKHQSRIAARDFGLLGTQVGVQPAAVRLAMDPSLVQ